MSRVRYELWLNRVRALSAKIISPFGISWGIRGHNQDTYANQESGWWGVLLRVGRTVGYNLRIPSTFNHLLVHGLIHQIYFDQKESIIRKTCLIMASFSSRPVPFLTSLPAFEDITWRSPKWWQNPTREHVERNVLKKSTKTRRRVNQWRWWWWWGKIVEVV